MGRLIDVSWPRTAFVLVYLSNEPQALHQSRHDQDLAVHKAHRVLDGLRCAAPGQLHIGLSEIYLTSDSEGGEPQHVMAIALRWLQMREFRPISMYTRVLL
jgi:hypothetical protein